ncbi:37874_t:CDS:2, partial [Gigaspora margarita]
RNDWERKPKWKVALKTLDKSAKITPEFINEIKICLKCGGGYGLIRCYGISQHPVSKNYIIVLYYAHKGNLRSYLDQHYDAEIADLGFAGPAEKQPLINKKTIYGVLPYIAPEILRGGKYTPEADVYSFGIIMCDVLCCIPPFDDRSHDAYLALGICLGLRPAIEKDSPKPFVKLMRLCWDANPINRPKANKLSEILDDWYWKLYDKLETPESLAFMASDNNMPQPGSQASSRTVTQTHPLAFYTSGSFSFQNLPIPINSPSINYRSSSASYSDMTRNIDFRTEHTRQPDTTTILESGIIESELSTINGSATSEVTSESDEYEYITRQLDLAL